MVTSLITAPVLRMRGGVCRCLNHAYQRARVRGLAVRRCPSCVRVRFPLLTAMDRHTGMGRYLYTLYTSTLPRTPIVVRGLIAEADMRDVRAEACIIRACRRALVCVRGRARIRANACEHFPPPLSVAFSARRRSPRLRPSTRISARGTPLPSRRCTGYAPMPARARTAADCARSVVDECAAVVRVADVRVHAHVAMCIRVYVDGPPMETHLCSSAIELPLHLGLSMSNAHMHRPFPRRMYTCSRLYASIARARACACVLVCVCGGVLHACKLRESIDIQTFYQASAFNANIGGWNTARVTDSYSVCAASGPAQTAADCARSVADACTAVARGGAIDVSARARARACACSYAYKGVRGWTADGHTPVLECHRAPSASKLIDVQRTHA
jgi:hypothetical protein